MSPESVAKASGRCRRNRLGDKKVEKYLVGKEKMLTFAPAKVRIALARMLTIH